MLSHSRFGAGLLCLGLAPQRLQSGDVLLGQGLVRQFLYPAEAADELFTGPMEGLLAVQAQKAPGLYRGKQQVAQLLLRVGTLPGGGFSSAASSDSLSSAGPISVQSKPALRALS